MVLYLEIWKLNFEKWEPPTEAAERRISGLHSM